MPDRRMLLVGGPISGQRITVEGPHLNPRVYLTLPTGRIVQIPEYGTSKEIMNTAVYELRKLPRTFLRIPTVAYFHPKVPKGEEIWHTFMASLKEHYIRQLKKRNPYA